MAPRKRGIDGRFKTSGGSLTGGTGDVKPQVITIALVNSTLVDQYSSLVFSVPRIIMGSVNSATIMELLKVWFYVGLENTADEAFTTVGALSTTFIRAQDSTVTLANLAGNAVFPTVFAYTVQRLNVSTNGGNTSTFPMTIDLTDNNGNGVLIATDQLFVTTGMLGNAVVSDSVVKILYRMVNVGITEYVGIVQSQIV